MHPAARPDRPSAPWADAEVCRCPPATAGEAGARPDHRVRGGIHHCDPVRVLRGQREAEQHRCCRGPDVFSQRRDDDPTRPLPGAGGTDPAPHRFGPTRSRNVLGRAVSDAGHGARVHPPHPPGRVPRGRAQRPPRRRFPNGCWCCLEVNIHATVLRCDIDTLRSAAICSLSYTGTDEPAHGRLRVVTRPPRRVVAVGACARRTAVAPPPGSR